MEILYKARTHPKILFKPLIIQLFLLALHFLAFIFIKTEITWVQPAVHGIILLLEVWYVVTPILQWWNNVFTITNDRVKNNWGVLYKHSREIRIDRIASISEERGILDRIFGCGTLNFYDAAAPAQPKTSGAWNKRDSNAGIQFKDVARIKHVREIIESTRK